MNEQAMKFARVERASVAERIAARIRDVIMGGDMRPGDALPNERALADQFGVNRSSVREALSRLEALGLVEVRHGGGTRVTDYLTTAGLQILPYLLAPGGQLDTALFEDLLDLRIVLLGWTTERAARVPAPARATELEAIITALEAAASAGDAMQVQRLDFDFFEVLVAGAHNRVLAMIVHAIRRVYLQHADKFAALYAGFDTQWHRRCARAVRRGQPRAAREAMEAYGREVIGKGSNPQR